MSASAAAAPWRSRVSASRQSLGVGRARETRARRMRARRACTRTQSLRHHSQPRLGSGWLGGDGTVRAEHDRLGRDGGIAVGEASVPCAHMRCAARSASRSWARQRPTSTARPPQVLVDREPRPVTHGPAASCVPQRPQIRRSSTGATATKVARADCRGAPLYSAFGAAPQRVACATYESCNTRHKKLSGAVTVPGFHQASPTIVDSLSSEPKCSFEGAFSGFCPPTRKCTQLMSAHFILLHVLDYRMNPVSHHHQKSSSSFLYVSYLRFVLLLFHFLLFLVLKKRKKC